MCRGHADKAWVDSSHFNDPSLVLLPLGKSQSKVRNEVYGHTLCETHMAIISSHLARSENSLKPQVMVSNLDTIDFGTR